MGLNSFLSGQERDSVTRAALEMARRKARFSSDRILGKMRALAVHFTTVYIYALTLTNPPPHLAHLKGIRRIGQTADHRGQGRDATLANRMRQYKQLRGMGILKELVEEIASTYIAASAGPPLPPTRMSPTRISDGSRLSTMPGGAFQTSRSSRP